MTTILLSVLGVLALAFAVVFFRSAGSAREGRRLPTWMELSVGFVTNFFDTLGIGNFAPTAAWFRFARIVPDERIPGTMNVGHTLPVVLMGFLFITIVEVEPLTLVTLIGAAIVGAWLGAGLVSRLPRRRIQVGMGLALLIAATLLIAGMFEAFPVGGTALHLEPIALAGAAVVLGLLGALMTIGVGLYAPCMILISLLGMDPKASFPIMMGACAFLMPVASSRFVAEQAYLPRPALGLTLGGIPAVLIAALIVKSLPLEALKWLVAVIVSYTAITMLYAARRSS